MSNFKSFAVLGAGALGMYVVEELLKNKLSVRVFTRDSTKVSFTQIKEKGAEVVSVDYDSPESIREALKGVEVVISTFGTSSIPIQHKVVDVAVKVESVKLFVPSEFGIGDYQHPSLINASEVVREKDEVRKQLEEGGQKWVAYAVGLFYGWVYSPYLGWNLAEKKARLAGTGETLQSFSDERDIAAFIVQSLVQIDISKFEKGRYLKMNSFQATSKDIVEHADEALHSHLSVERFAVEDVDVKSTTLNLDLVPFLEWGFDKGFSNYVPDHKEFGFKPKYTMADLAVH